MSVIIIGIDPGATGYISATRDGLVEFKKLPVKKILIGKTNRTLIDFTPLYWMLSKLKNNGESFCTIERQQPMQHDGKSSCFMMGRNYGAILNAVAFAAMPHDVVSPVTWKKHFGLGKRTGESAVSMKQRAADLASNLYPTVADDIAKDKDFGLAESLLIGRFGAIKHGLLK